MIPNIIYEGSFWEGKLYLEKWNDFYGKDLQLKLNVGGDRVVKQLTEVHQLGYSFLISQQKEILNIILNEVLDNYPTWQNEYGYDGKEKEIFMPDVSNVIDLRQLLYPEKVFIMDVELEKMPYIGIQFTCRWDEEHGIGVMFHKDRVVKIGGADIAFMTWIAENDNGGSLV
ncbi:MAG: hypothetical protein CR995_00615 [Clostridiales bacterium]|nr:MAG: hypothetical protein CR995_00615 [Clostridiales bacterium]